jgi:hypothetical protein
LPVREAIKERAAYDEQMKKEADWKRMGRMNWARRLEITGPRSTETAGSSGLSPSKRSRFKRLFATSVEAFLRDEIELLIQRSNSLGSRAIFLEFRRA